MDSSGDVLSLVFGHAGPLAAANAMFAHRVHGGGNDDALFDSHHTNRARAVVVAPQLVPQAISGTTTSSEQQEQAVGEIWGTGQVQRIQRDFAAPQTLAEAWFHKERSYFGVAPYSSLSTSSSSPASVQEAFANSVQYFLESIDRLGGVHVLVDASESSCLFVDATRAIELVADETCGTSLLKPKTVCCAWSSDSAAATSIASPLALGMLAPLVGTYVPLPSAADDSSALHVLSLPYRQRRIDFARYYQPVSRFPCEASITMLDFTTVQQQQQVPAAGGDVQMKSSSSSRQELEQRPWWGRVESKAEQTVASLTLDSRSRRWLEAGTGVLASRECRDFAMRRCMLEQDEHAELLSRAQTWVEDYVEEGL